MVKNVRISEVTPGMVVGHDICNKVGHLMMGQGTVLTAEIILQFDTWNINFVPVDFPDQKEEEVRKIIRKAMAGQLPPAYAKAMQMFLDRGHENKRQALDLAYKILDNLHTRKQIDRGTTKGIVAKMVQEVFDHREQLTSMLTMRCSDSSILNHSLNTCILAILVGHRMKLNTKQLLILGEAALLHDVGMTVIPGEITGKRGPLNDDEWFQVKKHPRISAELIQKMENAETELIRAVAQHHEREDGSGYPAGLPGRASTQFAKILAVVDVYDAMTSPRPYRAATAPYQTVKTLLARANGELNQQVIQAFIAELSLHPPGSLVTLNTGAIGMVIRANPQVPLRPILKMLRDEKNEPYDGDVFVDLLSNKTNYIAGGIFSPDRIAQLLPEKPQASGVAA